MKRVTLWGLGNGRGDVLDQNIKLALAPQVITEFLHIATDPRRFQQPLTMEQALAKGQF